MKRIIELWRKVRGAIGRPWRYLSAEWERMAPRERRLVAGLSIAVIMLGTGLGVFMVFSSISELEEGNADIRKALATIARHRNEYLEAKARTVAQEARLGNAPPQITGDVEAAAHEATVQIAESSERPAVPAGKRWLQHDVDLKVRSVSLQALTDFMKRVEMGPRPIFFTRLSLKHRFGESDTLDAELTATAFEHVKDANPTKKKSDSTGAGKGAAKDRP